MTTSFETKKTFRYEKRVVAFLDILGFTGLVRQQTSNGEEKFRKIFMAVDRMRRQKVKIERKHYSVEDLDYLATQFSDSLVMSAKASPESARLICESAIDVYAALMRQGIFLRGAVVVGDLFHDEDFLFGPGLIDAYELETSLARFPRIIISEKLHLLLKKMNGKGVRKGEDGLSQLNFLSQDWPLHINRHGTTKDRRTFYRDIKSQIKIALRKSNLETEIRAKYYMLAKMYNRAIRSKRAIKNKQRLMVSI